MRLPTALLAAACLIPAGCAPPANVSTVNSADTLSFPVGPSYSPTPPIVNTTETIVFTVQNNSTNSTSVTNIPYVIVRDKVASPPFSSATIPSIGPNATQTINFTVTESDGMPHTYEMILDPNNTTGAVNTSSNTQSVTIDWLPAASG